MELLFPAKTSVKPICDYDQFFFWLTFEAFVRLFL